MLRICDELKIDKSKVMKEAHDGVKTGRYKNMSEALKMAWFNAKYEQAFQCVIWKAGGSDYYE